MVAGDRQSKSACPPSLVVQCIEEVGQYSDDLRMVARPGTTYVAFYNREVSPVDFTSGTIQIIPNVATSWDINEDASASPSTVQAQMVGRRALHRRRYPLLV